MLFAVVKVKFCGLYSMNSFYLQKHIKVKVLAKYANELQCAQ